MSIGAELGQYILQTHYSKKNLRTSQPPPHLGTPVIVTFYFQTAH